MGNNTVCCISRGKDSYILNNELVIYRNFKNVTVRVKQGDILKESGEGVVCLYYNPDKTAFTQLYDSEVYQNLQKSSFDTIIPQPLQHEFFRLIIYYHVKQFENDRDLFQYYNGYRECLQSLNDEGLKDILISDCPNRLQRAFSAEVLIRSVMDFLEDSQQLNIKSITILNADKKCTRFLKYELIKYIEEYQQPSLRKERQNKFMKFITSTRSVTSKVPDDCNFSITDFELGDESRLIQLQEKIKNITLKTKNINKCKNKNYQQKKN
ncbi:hypothetical protein pb186bvf_003719 [Paramecium bursaria]